MPDEVFGYGSEGEVVYEQFARLDEVEQELKRTLIRVGRNRKSNFGITVSMSR